MKKRILLLAIPALVLLMTLAGCERVKNAFLSTNNNDDEGGTLTINNCPKIHGVLICKNTYPSSSGLDLALKKPYATSLRPESPFPLRAVKGKRFNNTGDFLVVIMFIEPGVEIDSVKETDFNLYFLENVSFNKGCAAIDFNDMKSSKSLYNYD